MADNNAFCAVDHEGALLCHEGEVTHEDFLFLDLASFLVDQAHPYPQRSSISSVPFFTFFHSIFWFSKTEIDEF